jgi:hypothetical protein
MTAHNLKSRPLTIPLPAHLPLSCKAPTRYLPRTSFLFLANRAQKTSPAVVLVSTFSRHRTTSTSACFFETPSLAYNRTVQRYRYPSETSSLPREGLLVLPLVSAILMSHYSKAELTHTSAPLASEKARSCEQKPAANRVSPLCTRCLGREVLQQECAEAREENVVPLHLL